MEEKGLPNFLDKVVIFYLKNTHSLFKNGIIMDHLQFEKRNGRIFLMGKYPELQWMKWVSNCQAAIEWDSVVHYIEFESMEDFKQRASKLRS